MLKLIHPSEGNTYEAPCLFWLSPTAAAVVPAVVSAGPITTGTVNVAYSHDAVVTIIVPRTQHQRHAGTPTISAVTGGLSSDLRRRLVPLLRDLYENLGSNRLNVALSA